jgi:hypothetical protein
MSAVAIVEGVAEGLQLLDNLIQAASSVSSAVNAAQASGTPLDLSTVLTQEAQAENAVLAAIAAAQAAGK